MVVSSKKGFEACVQLIKLRVKSDRLHEDFFPFVKLPLLFEGVLDVLLERVSLCRVLLSLVQVVKRFDFLKSLLISLDVFCKLLLFFL
jgi:hypothetical protein